jgi:hypothetical protein
MRRVRYTKKDVEIIDRMAEEMVQNMRKNTKISGAPQIQE